MYTSPALLDVHARAHRSLCALMSLCETLPSDAFTRELPGFGYPSVRLQLHHLIGAEAYWVGVIRGDFRAEEDDALYPTVAALERYRADVAAATAAHLQATTDLELNTAREMRTWGDRARTLVPARILMRVITHIYQHQGQVLAMCRILGSPSPGGTDFPLD